MILSVKEISLASRLKELLAEGSGHNGIPLPKKSLYSFEVGDKTKRINKNTITNWLDEKNPVMLDRIDKDALQNVADYLDVDIDYLLCKQVEKRKNFSKFNSQINKDEYIRQLHLLDVGKPLIKALGYEVTEKATGIETDILYDIIEEKYRETVKDKTVTRTKYYLIEYECNSPSGIRFELNKTGATVLKLTESEYFDLIDDMESYSLSRLKRLAERKQ